MVTNGRRTIRQVVIRALGLVGLALKRDLADMERRLRAAEDRAARPENVAARLRYCDERIAELLEHLRRHDRCPAWPDFRNLSKPR